MKQTTIYAISALVVLVDQVSKWQALRTLSPDTPIVLIPGWFDLMLVRNTGGAFGILRNGTWWLVAAAVAAVAFIIVSLMRASEPMPRTLGIGLALPLGGAIGNLIDRVRLGVVTDFVHVHAGLHDFPVFNVADSCICIGVGLLVIYFWSRPVAPIPIEDYEHGDMLPEPGGRPVVEKEII